jgi:hypothetical protein
MASTVMVGEQGCCTNGFWVGGVIGERAGAKGDVTACGGWCG